jgi:hypothetical protein
MASSDILCLSNSCEEELKTPQCYEGEFVDDEGAAGCEVAVVASVNTSERHRIEACTGDGKVTGGVDSVR